MTDSNYNGLTNRQTWLVDLWLTNEESDYNWMLALAQEAGDPGLFAQMLRNELEQRATDICGSTNMLNDLLQDALDCVNWREIAESLEWGDQP